MKNTELNEHRRMWNTKCCQMMETILTQFPFLRLGQLMSNIYGDDDMFFEEPQYTYRRLEEYYNKLKANSI